MTSEHAGSASVEADNRALLVLVFRESREETMNAAPAPRAAFIGPLSTYFDPSIHPVLTITAPCCGRVFPYFAFEELPEHSLVCPCGSGHYLFRYRDEF